MLYKSIQKNQEEKSNARKQGDDTMSNSAMPYAALDLHALSKKNVKIISSKDALKDVVPIPWEEDVLEGNRRVIVAKEKKEE